MNRGFRIWDIASECYLPVSRGGNDGVLGVTIEGNGIIYLEDGEVNIQLAENAGVIIERSTGLKDKNSKEIYEGDIIKCYSQDTYPIGRVMYSEEYAEYEIVAYDASSLKDYSLEHFSPIIDKYLEVIGKVHENPEMLEDK